MDQGGVAAEGHDIGRLREEKQRQRRVADAVGNPRHHPRDGDFGAVAATAANRRDRKTDEGAEPIDGDDHADRQQTRR